MDRGHYAILIIISIIFLFWLSSKFETKTKLYSKNTKSILEKFNLNIPEDKIEYIGKRLGLLGIIGWVVWTVILLYGSLQSRQLGVILIAGTIGYYFIKKPKIKINELEINLKDLDDEILKKHFENENLRTEFKKSLTSIQTIDAHRRYLIRTLKEANHSIVILSGWATDFVIDKEFKNLVKGCLNRGVNIFLGFGYKKSNEVHIQKDYEIQAKKNFAELQDWSSSNQTKGMLHIREFKNHSKILICDDIFAICGSFNWLSNRNSQNREKSWVSKNYNFVSEQLNEIIKFFDDYKEEHSRREFFRKFNNNLYPK